MPKPKPAGIRPHITHFNGCECVMARLDKCMDALKSVDAYFKACVVSWSKGDGKLVDARGMDLVEGNEKLSRLCNEAAEKVLRALEERDKLNA